MNTFVIRDEASGEDVAVDARSIDEAVEEYVREHSEDGWSDSFTVTARAQRDTRWRVFPIFTRVELVVEVGNAQWGDDV